MEEVKSKFVSEQQDDKHRPTADKMAAGFNSRMVGLADTRNLRDEMIKFGYGSIRTHPAILANISLDQKVFEFANVMDHSSCRFSLDNAFNGYNKQASSWKYGQSNLELSRVDCSTAMPMSPELSSPISPAISASGAAKIRSNGVSTFSKHQLDVGQISQVDRWLTTQVVNDHHRQQMQKQQQQQQTLDNWTLDNTSKCQTKDRLTIIGNNWLDQNTDLLMEFYRFLLNYLLDDKEDRDNLLFRLNEYLANLCDFNELLTTILKTFFVPDKFKLDPLIKFKLLHYIKELYMRQQQDIANNYQGSRLKDLDQQLRVSSMFDDTPYSYNNAGTLRDVTSLTNLSHSLEIGLKSELFDMMLRPDQSNGLQKVPEPGASERRPRLLNRSIGHNSHENNFALFEHHDNTSKYYQLRNLGAYFDQEAELGAMLRPVSVRHESFGKSQSKFHEHCQHLQSSTRAKYFGAMNQNGPPITNEEDEIEIDLNGLNLDSNQQMIDSNCNSNNNQDLLQCYDENAMKLNSIDITRTASPFNTDAALNGNLYESTASQLYVQSQDYATQQNPREVGNGYNMSTDYPFCQQSQSVYIQQGNPIEVDTSSIYYEQQQRQGQNRSPPQFCNNHLAYADHNHHHHGGQVESRPGDQMPRFNLDELDPISAQPIRCQSSLSIAGAVDPDCSLVELNQQRLALTATERVQNALPVNYQALIHQRQHQQQERQSSQGYNYQNDEPPCSPASVPEGSFSYQNNDIILQSHENLHSSNSNSNNNNLTWINSRRPLTSVLSSTEPLGNHYSQIYALNEIPTGPIQRASYHGGPNDVDNNHHYHHRRGPMSEGVVKFNQPASSLPASPLVEGRHYFPAAVAFDDPRQLQSNSLDRSDQQHYQQPYSHHQLYGQGPRPASSSFELRPHHRNQWRQRPREGHEIRMIELDRPDWNLTGTNQATGLAELDQQRHHHHHQQQQQPQEWHHRGQHQSVISCLDGESSFGARAETLQSNKPKDSIEFAHDSRRSNRLELEQRQDSDYNDNKQDDDYNDDDDDDDGERDQIDGPTTESVVLVPSVAKGRLPLSVAEQMSEQASKFVQHYGSTSAVTTRSSLGGTGYINDCTTTRNPSNHFRHHHQQQQHQNHHDRKKHPPKSSSFSAILNQNQAKTPAVAVTTPAPTSRNQVQVRRTLRVKIRKSKPILGIAIEGGFNVSGQLLPRIVCVHEEGAAYQCGKLRASDLILEVNGVKTANMTHDQIAETIANAYYQDERSHIEFLIGESIHV